MCDGHSFRLRSEAADIAVRFGVSFFNSLKCKSAYLNKYMCLFAQKRKVYSVDEHQ